jgi:hypothetical protein
MEEEYSIKEARSRKTNNIVENFNRTNSLLADVWVVYNEIKYPYRIKNNFSLKGQTQTRH